MKTKFQQFSAALVLLLGLGFTPLLVPVTANAAAKDEICKGAGGTSAANCKPAGENVNLKGFIQNIVNILLFIVGAVSVIMIIVGGLRYVLSGGDQSAVTSAKNTIMYAIVGVVVAFMAYAIVNFVVVNLVS